MGKTKKIFVALLLAILTAFSFAGVRARTKRQLSQTENCVP